MLTETPLDCQLNSCYYGLVDFLIFWVLTLNLQKLSFLSSPLLCPLKATNIFLSF